MDHHTTQQAKGSTQIQSSEVSPQAPLILKDQTLYQPEEGEIVSQSVLMQTINASPQRGEQKGTEEDVRANIQLIDDQALNQKNEGSHQKDDRQGDEEEKRPSGIDDEDAAGNNRRNLKRAAKTEGLELIKVRSLATICL